MLSKLRLWWQQRWCEHWWRPACGVKFKGLYRWCPDCKKSEPLSKAQFFAEFGESVLQRLYHL